MSRHDVARELAAAIANLAEEVASVVVENTKHETPGYAVDASQDGAVYVARERVASLIEQLEDAEP